jgi:hypothetical protein
MAEHRADEQDHRSSEPRPRRSRRATTPPPEGSDPTPEPEPGRHSAAENDEQLKRDKPPHWG